MKNNWYFIGFIMIGLSLLFLVLVPTIIVIPQGYYVAVTILPILGICSFLVGARFKNKLDYGNRVLGFIFVTFGFSISILCTAFAFGIRNDYFALAGGVNFIGALLYAGLGVVGVKMIYKQKIKSEHQ